MIKTEREVAAELDKKIIKYQAISGPGCILLGLGLYEYVNPGASLFPPQYTFIVTYGFLVAGPILMLIGFWKIMGVIRKKVALQNRIKF